jgi:hypothetical protein
MTARYRSGGVTGDVDSGWRAKVLGTLTWYGSRQSGSTI